MLKITKAIDPILVTTVTVNIYSPPGIGKTSTGYTAEKPLLIDFDRGSHRSRNRRDSVQVETWEDVLSITADDLKPYKTVIADTAGRALDVLTPYIIKNNAKHGRGGALTLQGYGELKSQFIAWMKFIRSFGLDVVLLSHSDETKSGDEMIERLDIQGGSKNEIYKAADAMGRLYLNGSKRWLNFSPTDTTFGKNPAGLPPLEVPDFEKVPDFLATVIARTKAALNALSAEQTEIAGLLSAWKDKVDAAKTAADFNALLPLGKELDERIRDNAKRVIVKAAKDLDIVVKDGAFVGGKQAEAPKPATAAEQPKAETAEGAADPKAPADTNPESGTGQPALPASETTLQSEAAPAEREVGSDDEDEANRKAAEPTAEEMAQMELGKAAAPATGGRAKKGRAA
jgi:hypothetical protein